LASSSLSSLSETTTRKKRKGVGTVVVGTAEVPTVVWTVLAAAASVGSVGKLVSGHHHHHHQMMLLLLLLPLPLWCG
jgi:hypothetical protein